jgi:hypothetical protein
MSRPLPTEWLVDEPCVLVKADGDRVATAIRIGVPYQLGGQALPDNYESHCPVHVEGLVELGGPMIGVSTLSALVSALRTVATFASWRVADDGELVEIEGGTAYAELLAPLRLEEPA